MTVIERTQPEHPGAHCPHCNRDIAEQIDLSYELGVQEGQESVAAQLQGAVNEAKRLECALEQVRARFNESDMRGVRETLEAALSTTTGGQSAEACPCTRLHAPALPSLRRGRRFPEDRRAEYERGDPMSHTVIIHGASDDLIEVEGEAPGCDEYNGENATFILHGEAASTRVAVSYITPGVWALQISPVDDGVPMLPTLFVGLSERYDGTPGYSARAGFGCVERVTVEVEPHG